MSLRSACLAALAVLSLAACGQDSGTADGSATTAAAPAPDAARPAPAQAAALSAQSGVVLTSEGLRITGGAAEPGRVVFGESREVVVSDIGGRPTQSPNPDCPNGPSLDLQWPSGLQIITQNGEFVGWKVDSGDLATASGIRVGSTRAQVAAAPGFALTPNNFDQVTFSVDDGVSGVFASAEPAAAVTQLYAGYTCIAD